MFLHPLRRARLLRAAFAGSALLTLTAGAARAQPGFTELPWSVSAACSCSRQFTWNWPAAAAFADPPGVNWDVFLDDAANPVAGRDLTVEVQHMVSCDGDVAPNPNWVRFQFPGVVQPPGPNIAIAVQAAQRSHLALNGDIHWDFFKTTLRVNPAAPGRGKAIVIVEAEHSERRRAEPLRSFQNWSEQTLALTLQPNYRDPAGGIVTGATVSRGSVPNGGDESSALPQTRNGLPLTGYTLAAQGTNGQTKTTLAFPGKVDEQPSQLDLGEATTLFVGGQPFLAPFFYLPGRSLFVAIDLTQWLGDEASFHVGDAVVFNNGASPQLPGVLVSNTPISFTPGGGFTSGSPFTGSVVIRGALGGQTTPAQPFCENWDSYPNGTLMHNVNGWKGWDNAPDAGGFIRNAPFLSAPNAIEINGTTDQVHEFGGFDDGPWVFRAMQFIPNGSTPETYFIVLNTYEDGGAQTVDRWSVQMHFNPLNPPLPGMVVDDFSFLNQQTPRPILPGQWAEIRAYIDLDADTVSQYYNGQLISTRLWNDSDANGQPDPGGHRAIAALDLFANNAGPVYYDDISLTRPWDVNYDCATDDADLGVVLFSQGAQAGDPDPSQPPYNLAADVNNDGSVDDADLGLVLAHQGE